MVAVPDLVAAVVAAVAAAVAGSDENAASVVYAADKPVTFEQTPGGGAEPATKLTVEHYIKIAV